MIVRTAFAVANTIAAVMIFRYAFDHTSLLMFFSAILHFLTAIWVVSEKLTETETTIETSRDNLTMGDL